MHLQPGALLQGGKYRIIRFIKNGGFGCTYDAWHTGFDARVAIKEFFPKNFCNRESDNLHVTVGTESNKTLIAKLKGKFIDEARALRKLSHPGIVKVSDVFDENGTAYYVMDYIDGSSLEEVAERTGPMSESDALSYIREVCSALAYVHSRNRLHLDIKPGNIMVDNEGHVILIDFGTSKQYDEESNLNTSTLLGMTFGYAPLEQSQEGGVREFHPSTDIYALGATLYRLLTGQTPPNASHVNEFGLPPLPHTVSALVRSAVERAMSPKRIDRPQDVDEFLAMMDEGTIVPPPPPPPPPSPKKSFLKWILGLIAGLVAAAVLCLVINRSLDPETTASYRDGILHVKGVEYPMVYVSGGSFDMGATSEQTANNPDSDEYPVHRVTLSSYSIGKYEVTQELWKAVMGSNPSRFKGSRKPVEQVSWDNCQEFIRKLNDLTGANFRLPTEAEWEFAARGGNSSRGYKYSGSDTIGDVAWYDNNSGNETHAVGGKSANELGLYDMSGNVWEWCNDWYGSCSSSSQTNPKGPSVGSNRVNRGGSWYCNAGRCRVSNRGSDTPGYRGNFIGLRLCH